MLHYKYVSDVGKQCIQKEKNKCSGWEHGIVTSLHLEKHDKETTQSTDRPTGRTDGRAPKKVLILTTMYC